MTSPFEQDDFDQFDSGSAAESPAAFCLTVVASDDLQAVLDVLLPRRRVEVTTWSGARDWVMENFDGAGGYPLAASAHAGAGWTTVWEDNGFQGSLDRSMTRLSRLGRAISVFRNVNALSSFVLAENRRIVRRFDPLSHDSPRSRTVGEPLADEPLLDWTVPRCGSAAVTMLANLSGLYPEWPRASDEAFVYFN